MGNSFKNDHLSASRITRYVNCPKSFELHYIQGKKSEPGIAAIFGIILHKVLELYFKYVIDEEYAGKIDEQKILSIYQDTCPKYGLTNFEFYQEGITILKKYVQNNPMVDHRDVLAIEQKFNLMIGDYLTLGYIDRVDRVDDNTIAINDYKSNFMLFGREEMDNSIQLSIYLMAARKLWPWAKNILLYFYMLRHGKRLETTRTEEQLSMARDFIINIGNQTESVKEFPEQLNAYCIYCDHKNQCFAYQDVLSGKIEIVSDIPSDLESVACERERIAKHIKILNARKGDLEGVIKANLKEKQELLLAGFRYKMFNITKYSYPVEDTINLLTESSGITRDELISELTVIDKKLLDALLKKLGKKMRQPEVKMLKARLEVKAETSYSSRFWAKEIAK